MKIGILYEGFYDKKPLYEIVRKILLELKPALEEKERLTFFPLTPDGDIEDSIKRATRLFFDVLKCDLGIFIADSGGNESKVRRVRNSVARWSKAINPSVKYICGFPDPELEQWFFDEEDAVKNTLDLKRDSKISCGNLMPKERLERLISERNGIGVITDSRLDIYVTIASSLNLGKLRLCSPSFKRFYAAIGKKI